MSYLARMRPFVLAALLVFILLPGAAALAAGTTATTATSPSSARSTRATTQPAIKDVVVLSELVDKYEAVPFSHKSHARMAEMWNGCETCHHHTPAPTTGPTKPAVLEHPTQDLAAAVPACKSCHPVADNNVSIHLPSLKGAYHRQCLNCHRDWMESNACVICHAVRGETAASGPAHQPTPDDITGRMHKPIPAPTTREYVARFTPVAGEHVLFRHEEHTRNFGIKCAVCHHQDTCASCHAKANPTTQTGLLNGTSPAGMSTAGTGSHPLKPGRTWQDTHGPCASCHLNDRCNHCHYQDLKTPPPPFNHATTGQTLDKDHVKLACAQCHQQYKSRDVTCGSAACHEKPISFPADRPGPYTPPATLPATPATRPATAPATQPGTKPVMIKIRRGGA